MYFPFVVHTCMNKALLVRTCRTRSTLWHTVWCMYMLLKGDVLRGQCERFNEMVFDCGRIVLLTIPWHHVVVVW